MKLNFNNEWIFHMTKLGRPLCVFTVLFVLAHVLINWKS